MSRTLTIHILIAALAMAAYWPVLNNGFVDLDDPEYVRDNDWVKRGLTFEGVAGAFTTGHVSNWHPLTWISLMIDVEAQRLLGPAFAAMLPRDEVGLFPGAFHLTNLLLHIINAMLLMRLFSVMTGRVWPSAMVAAIFAVHPVHVESVAWIAERKDVLSMLFMLLTIRAYTFYVRDRDWGSYLFVVVFFTLGLMSKPMLVTLPFVMMLLDVWPLRQWSTARDGARLALEKVPLLAMSIAAGIITYIVQQGAGHRFDGVWSPLHVKLGNAIVSYVQYIGIMFWPIDLTVLYPNPSHIGDPSWSLTTIVVSAALLVGVTILFVICNFRRREHSYWIVGWLWFVGTLVPVIGLVQIGRHTIADRYAYIPFIGLYIIIAFAVADLCARWKRLVTPACIAICIMLALCTVATHRQSLLWRDSISLFEHTLAVTDRNWMIHNNLAGAHERRGNLDEAELHLLKAIEIYPDGGSLRRNLGTFYSLKMKRHYDAQLQFEKAVEIDPNDARSHHNLAVVLASRSLPERAIFHSDLAVRADPNVPEYRVGLATLLANGGLFEDAVEQLEMAKRLDEAKAGDYDRLIELFRARIVPNEPADH